MGTQDSGFLPISFSSTFPQQAFRLVELPPELVALIEARKEIRLPRLQFKSAGQPLQHNSSHSSLGGHGSAGATATSEGFLHLCSEEKVWAVKQVSTSNTVFVTKACDAPINDRDLEGDVDMDESEEAPPAEGRDDMSGTGKPSKGVTTIAEVKSILELIPVEPSEDSVQEQMLSMVHALTDRSMDVHLSEPHDRTSYSFQEVLDNIPAPTAVCCRVAKNLLLIHDPASSDPARKICSSAEPSLLLSAWKEFMQQCIILGYKIDAPARAQTHSEPPTFSTVFQQLEEQHDQGLNATAGDFPSTLIRAILRRFKTRSILVPKSSLDDMGKDMLDDEFDWAAEPLNSGWDAEHLTLKLGEWQLQNLLMPDIGSTDTSKKDIRTDVFLDTHWKDLVPDSWHPFCSVDALLALMNRTSAVVELFKASVPDEFGIPEQKDFIRVAGTGTVQGMGSGIKAISATTTGGDLGRVSAETLAAAAAKNQKKRKWHEKFGAQRNAASKK
ncbi:hypothetical protein LTR84_008524 [Exophiala bonariae]|uniref:Sister chromatid cohesion protein Dcc1 n=1 Tax=Exophiala bonariae TaxID=1690606 RepID=A0AAV9MWM8_9EURO|nr:hypothetical protein LTR84_008524 [Exophiala bonariae]